MVRSPRVGQWLFIASASVGIACGTDTQGTAAVRSDAGNLALLDEGGAGSPGPNSASVGSTMGSGGGGGANPSGGSSSGLNTGDAASASAGDSGTAATGDSAGPQPNAGGADAAGDGATADGGAPGGGAVCGPNGTMSCGQKQYCDTTLGCVGCLMDSQCPAAMRWCLQGSCVQCRTNADCGTGTTPACYPADHSCRTACLTNQDCQGDGAPICNVTTGACVGCNTSHDCPTSQPVCDSVSQQCVQCASNADCSGTSTPACVRNRCVACATNADCPGATPYCSAGDGTPQCVQCLQSSQCPPSVPNCNSGTCAKSSG